ncbi:cache domain-containing protein [Azospirillum sp. SYSU D00513]|uniref:methyl-accepting chemotaxis protein n=1 Tax=Azospirillum sp. SYSU D00513 TaxID=2812561 RepID=UPI001A95AA66|nr:cache domain-containing protein [Azospirillum sp. SYSU D00513]
MLNLHLSIRAKLWGLVAAASVASFAIAGSGLYLNQQRMYEDRVHSLKALVDAGHSLAVKLEADAAAGAIGRDQAQERFKELLLSLKYHGNGYLFAYTYDNFGFAHPNAKVMGKDASGLKDANGVPILPAMVAVARRGEGTYLYPWFVNNNGAEETEEKLSYVRGFEPWQIFISTGVTINDLQAAFYSQLWTLLGVIALLALPAIALIALVGQNVSTAIARLGRKMHALAGGDLSVEFPEAGRRDEIGAMAKAVRVFRENAQARVRLEAEQSELARRAEEEKRQAMLDLAADFEGSVKGIVETVASAAAEMQGSASSLSSAAGHSVRQITAIAAASEQASANVQTVAAATEELSASIGEIGRQVATSTRISVQAVDEAERTSHTINGLVDAVSQIGEVVGLINSIAGQTNLLALNATIEAARAGEAGKGFAVVASEVKALATQTARATEEIQAKVKEIQGATGSAQGAIADIGRTIGQMNEIATAIASAIEQQNAATRDISGNVAQAARGTGEVSSNIVGVNRAATDTGAAASQVLGASEGLAREAERLREEVAGFIATLKAA